MRIDRCVCDGWTFAEAEAVASAAPRRPACLAGLQEELRVGTGCGLCHPSLRRMLETGETVFREVIPDDGGAKARCECCPPRQAQEPLAPSCESRRFEI